MSHLPVPFASASWSPWRKIAVIGVIVICTIALVVVGPTLSAFGLERPADEWRAALLVAGGVINVISAVLLTYLWPICRSVWLQSKPEERVVAQSLTALGRALRRPARFAAVTTVLVALFAAGLYFIPASTTLEPGPIRLMVADDESGTRARSTLIEQWNNEHPENPIQVLPVADGAVDQYDRIVRDVTGERTADLYALDVVWMAEFIEREYIQEIDESELPEDYRDDFIDNVLATCMRPSSDDDSLWALPWNSDAGLLYTRRGAPVPQSWDDYFGEQAVTTLDEFTGKAEPGDDPAAEESGLLAAHAATLNPNEEILAVVALEAMWANGSSVITEEGKVVLDSGGQAVSFDGQALEAVRKLATATAEDSRAVLAADARDGGATPAAEAVEEDARIDFEDGHTLYLRDWSVADSFLEKEWRNGGSTQYQASPLPGGSALGGQNLAVSRWTDKPRAAQAAAEFLTSRASSLLLFEAGGFTPTRESVFDVSGNLLADTLQSAVRSARPRPVTTRYTEFSEVFRAGIAEALANDGELPEDFDRDLAEVLNGDSVAPNARAVPSPAAARPHPDTSPR